MRTQARPAPKGSCEPSAASRFGTPEGDPVTRLRSAPGFESDPRYSAARNTSRSLSAFRCCSVSVNLPHVSATPRPVGQGDARR